ncbi:hypothetical protein [Nocardiopsis potens]|uniref:hypothetical protein n=1 Tax=Nocardiopsis potens TaxID=1246458 RepID=UPI000348B343|nr:hypothetical protein [Nocardiopsis potens]
MDGILHLAADALAAAAALPADFGWTSNPDLPDFEGEHDPIQSVINWGQGIIVVIGIIGILFAAGKMAVGKFGRSDLAADGVGGLVWTVMGISLMLVAIPIINAVANTA